jgi:sec-independent protein translocase protein TatA
VKLLNPWDLLIVVFLLLLIFGSKRLPQMGRSLGEGIRGFRDSITDRIDRQDAQAEAEERARADAPRSLPPGQSARQPQTPRERDTVL